MFHWFVKRSLTFKNQDSQSYLRIDQVFPRKTQGRSNFLTFCGFGKLLDCGKKSCNSKTNSNHKLFLKDDQVKVQ